MKDARPNEQRPPFLLPLSLGKSVRPLQPLRGLIGAQSLEGDHQTGKAHAHTSFLSLRFRPSGNLSHIAVSLQGSALHIGTIHAKEWQFCGRGYFRSTH